MVDVSRFDTADAAASAVISSSTTLIELGARTLLARVVARRLEPTDPRNIGALAVRQYRCKFSRREFLDLAEWAAARGWAVGSPDKVPCVTLTKGRRTIILPLAAMQAKVDGEWRDLGDVIAEKESRWLVPASLDGLVQ